MSKEFIWIDEIAEEYAKWCMNKEHRGWGNLNSFKKLYQPKEEEKEPVIYTQEYVDELCEKAFGAAREDLFSKTVRMGQSKVFDDIARECYAYKSYQDYKKLKPSIP